ncbi:MAG TPA: BRO family protein [Verrucomicrobiae bacterium]|nr:BRO family protein [Verrucomicrobiae bacterium]
MNKTESNFQFSAVFGYAETEVRVLGTPEEPLFVLADLCRALGLGNASMAAQRLNSDDLRLMEVTDSLGRAQNAHVVNESGMYDLILRSDRPEAKAFRRWVTKEVLPAIRRRGSYSRMGVTLDPIMIELFCRARTGKAQIEIMKAMGFIPPE